MREKETEMGTNKATKTGQTELVRVTYPGGTVKVTDVHGWDRDELAEFIVRSEELGRKVEQLSCDTHLEYMELRTLATYERLREKYLNGGLSYELFRTYSRLCRRYNRKVGA